MKKNISRLLCALLSMILALGVFAGVAVAEQPTGDAFAIDTVHHGFRVYQIESIDYLALDLYFMEHEKTGAQLIYAACDDKERAFGVAFRTESKNDKGLPHVFEHSALSGCEKYPDSNLVFSMMNQTYNTYINAETRQFATLYPISSLSEEQLFADMDLYMDGVLHPILLKDERAMMREAWHYNLDDPEDDITISGVVYSEMAANFGVMQYVAADKLKKTLFPGSYSSNNVGGDPAVIPDMTYQELLDFHATYYHPSNMLMMLYGDFSDIERFLAHLNTEYLSKYERSEVVFDDPDYRPVEGYRELYYRFPATQSAETDHAAYIDYAFVLQDITPLDYSLMSIASVSLGMESSPIKQRMSRLFPTSSFAVTLEKDTAQPTLQFTLFNAEEGDAQAFKEAVDEMIPVITQGRIDESAVDMIINNMRYSRAMSRESANSGVGIFGTIVDGWSNTGRPDAFMEDVRIMDELEKYKEDGSIDAVLGKYLVNSPASAMVVTVPEPGLAEKNDAELAARLAEMKASMTEEEIRELVDKCADYNAWIENNAKVSLIDQMKIVDAASLPEEYETAAVTDETIDGVRYITSEVPDGEIFDMSVYLDAQGLPFESLLDASLATALIGSIGTENYSREALQAEMFGKLNSLSNYIRLLNNADEPAHLYYQITGSGLSSQIDDTFRLAEEIILHTDFNDYDTIREVAAENALLVDLYASAMPNLFLDALGKAAVRPDYYPDYYLGCSSEYTQYFENVAQMSDEELAEVVSRMQAAVEFMLNRPGAIVTAVGSAESVERCIEGANAFLSKLGNEAHEAVDYGAYSNLKGNVALVSDTSVAYDYTFLNMLEAGEAITGQRLVAQSVVTDMILLPEIRFRNNAYGASNSVGLDFSVLSTYRDPNIAKTYEVFDTVPEKLRALELTDAQLDGYITATYSSIVEPRGPVTKAREAVEDALNGRDPGRRLRYITQIKATTADDVRAAADLYEKINKEGTIVVGLSEEMYSANADMFDTVLRPNGD